MLLGAKMNIYSYSMLTNGIDVMSVNLMHHSDCQEPAHVAPQGELDGGRRPPSCELLRIIRPSNN